MVKNRDDCPMKARVQELLQLGDQLYSKRFPLLTLWQSFAENFYPIRADMTRSRYISEEFASADGHLRCRSCTFKIIHRKPDSRPDNQSFTIWTRSHTFAINRKAVVDGIADDGSESVDGTQGGQGQETRHVRGRRWPLFARHN